MTNSQIGSTGAVSVDPARIVVGVDGSDSSIHALRWAASLAGVLGCRLDAIMTWQYPTDYGYGWVGPPLQWNPAVDAEKALGAALLQAAADGSLPVEPTPQVMQGNPARVLIDASASALMVVLGSRGHGGFAGMLLGSVSASVAEHAKCPVLVVHGDAAAPVAATRS